MIAIGCRSNPREIVSTLFCPCSFARFRKEQAGTGTAKVYRSNNFKSTGMLDLGIVVKYAELAGAVTGSGNDRNTSPGGKSAQHQSPVLLSSECDHKEHGADTEVCVFQDNNPGTMTQACTENNSTFSLRETPCPVLVPGSQAENVAHVEPDKPGTSDKKHAGKACHIPVSLFQCAIVFGSPLPLTMKTSSRFCATVN